MKPQVLVISGPVGVGKTSVAEEVSEVLDERNIYHTYIDFDQLRYTYPRIPEDPWSNELGLQNLAAIWQNALTRGAKNLVLATVVEDNDFIERLSSTIPNAMVFTFQLFASPETLVQRVEKREIGSGLEWHKNRSLELLNLLQADSVPCDLRIDTDGKTVQELATEIADKVEWN